ncbi:MAG: DUF1624 domain-containing protein [Rhizobiales bacterium]|nr:DUF1624 domain-containing protein [Hyphomicrobiales bacterium]
MDNRAQTPSRRIALIDALRGAALAAMAIYHFAWDLGFFALADLGVDENPLWTMFARVTAASFLVLVGVSLVLAHGERIKGWAFARRLTMVVAAALAITLASAITDPEGLIVFGILHSIAVSSVLGLVFLRMPIWIVIGVAATCIAAPHFLTSPAFDAPGWLWLGLAREPQPSNDYVPLLPWFAAVLAGIAVARLLRERAATAAWARWQPNAAAARLLAFTGRHSLIVYLAHQPLLMGVLWLMTQALGARAG